VVFARVEVELANDEYSEHRTVELARNRIHVALTGDTAGDIYGVQLGSDPRSVRKVTNGRRALLKIVGDPGSMISIPWAI